MCAITMGICGVVFPERRLFWRVREIVHLLLEYGAEMRQELESAFC
jgi:hypothetical protein